MMNINMIKALLVNKWGNFEDINGYFEQGLMPFISNVTRMNIIFHGNYESMIQKVNLVNSGELIKGLKINLSDDVIDLYKECNGFRLFNNSLVLFGIPFVSKVPYNTLDLISMNIRAKQEISKYEDFLALGTVGKDFYFGYCYNNMNEILVIDRRNSTIMQKYQSLSDFLSYYISKLIDMFDGNCKFLFSKKKYEKYPVLANSLTELL